jgi:hypothetical protein
MTPKTEEIDEPDRDWRYYRSRQMPPDEILRALGVVREPPIWADEVAGKMGVLTGDGGNDDIEGVAQLSFVNEQPVILVRRDIRGGHRARNVHFAVLLGRLLRDKQCSGPAWMKPPYAIFPDDGGDDGSAKHFAEDLLTPSFAVYAAHVHYSLDKLSTIYVVPREFVAGRLRRHLAQE